MGSLFDLPGCLEVCSEVYAILVADSIFKSGRIEMEHRHGKLTLTLMTLALLLVLAIGPAAAPGLAGAVEMEDGLHGLLAQPYSGGGGGTGGG